MGSMELHCCQQREDKDSQASKGYHQPYQDFQPPLMRKPTRSCMDDDEDGFSDMEGHKPALFSDAPPEDRCNMYDQDPSTKPQSLVESNLPRQVLEDLQIQTGQYLLWEGTENLNFKPNDFEKMSEIQFNK